MVRNVTLTMDGWKEASFTNPVVGKVRVTVVSGLGNARRLLDAIGRGEVRYDFVEVMACPGGCTGGSQPIHDGQELYRDYLGKPLSEKSHHLLYTDHLAWEMPAAQKQ